MRKTTNKRHIAKTVSWRVVGTIDTIMLSWLISGNPLASLKIGLSEVFTKMILYFLHEKAWSKINLSRYRFFQNSQRRHITKTVTWRMIGTMDTIMLAWIITGNPYDALKIGLSEVVTKMLLYYLHERVWYKIKFGVVEVEEGRGDLLKERKRVRG